MLLLISIVFITVFISANCSLYEAVLYSTRRASLEAAKNQNQKTRLASLMIEMKNNISKPIAAILILNTIANTAGASVAGMYAADIFGHYWVPLFSLVFTLLILFLAEIMPKTIGAVHWKGLWSSVVYPLNIMKNVLAPLIFITEKFTKVFTKKRQLATITEDEILALVHLGAREGEISKDESRMVRNIINLEDKLIREIMTPRKMIFSLPSNITVGKAMQMLSGKGHSRIPVYDGDKENITGYIMLHDISSADLIHKPDTPLKSIIRPISFVPQNTNCLTVLTTFLKQRKQIAIVIDEFGGVDGLVSLEDLLETVLGSEIVDETDRIVDLQEAARKKKPKN
jgi:CBS domain containing-hemolysin-like protein